MTETSKPSQTSIEHLINSDHVSGAIYTDPEIFDLEMQRLFARSWLYIGHESQIPEPGDYFTTRLGPADVIVVRDGKRNINIFKNRCTHRSAHLCGYSHGHSKRFTCPYHGWSFNLEGKLHSVPMPGEYGPSFDKKAHALEQVPCVDNYRGFLFAKLEPDGVDLDSFLGPVAQAFNDLLDRSPSGEIEPIEGVIRHRYRANWKMMFENLNDIYHPVYSHASSAQGIREVADPEKLHRIMRGFVGIPEMVPMMQKLNSTITQYGHSFVSGLISIMSPDIPRDEHFNILAEAYGEARALEILSADLHLVLIYPSCTINPSQQTIRIVRPISVDETEVLGYCFKLKGVPDYVTRNGLYYCNYAGSAFSPVVADDLEIYERAQQNLRDNPDAVNDCARGLDQDRIKPAGTSEEYIRHQYEVWLEQMADKETVSCPG